MSCALRYARPVCYLLITAGCLLAFASAFAPQPTGAWHLAAAYLLCGLIPYVVYGSSSDLLDGCVLQITGLVLLVVDISARMRWDIYAAGRDDVLPAIVLCTLLILVALPAGVLLGKLARRVLA